MIAGIVLARHASLGTRNVAHFEDLLTRGLRDDGVRIVVLGIRRSPPMLPLSKNFCHPRPISLGRDDKDPNRARSGEAGSRESICCCGVARTLDSHTRLRRSGRPPRNLSGAHGDAPTPGRHSRRCTGNSI
jgi:hypothetical protein